MIFKYSEENDVCQCIFFATSYLLLVRTIATLHILHTFLPIFSAGRCGCRLERFQCSARLLMHERPLYTPQAASH